ncbi:hypothetical protein HID58_048380 [Brassica napus]|uniref:DUF4283 domain-containing protein n=1 Tax=Brassica napus TaxID=3708 RepID=A0ABQ8B208_BRANA|nr:hypothetical protein HID58_048380 [Brassica napus]
MSAQLAIKPPTIDSIPLWTHVQGVPFDLFTREGLSLMAGNIGDPVEADEFTIRMPTLRSEPSVQNLSQQWLNLSGVMALSSQSLLLTPGPPPRLSLAAIASVILNRDVLMQSGLHLQRSLMLQTLLTFRPSKDNFSFSPKTLISFEGKGERPLQPSS